MTRLLLCALALCLLALSGHAQTKPKPAPAPAPAKTSYNAADVERRVTAALEWLVDHQNNEGYWSAASFGQDTARPRAARKGNLQWVKTGVENGDAGVTANEHIAMTSLALLAFTGSGYDHKDGGYQSTVRNAILWLRKLQQPSGLFGQEGSCSMVHDHAVATMAMCEVYGLSGDQLLQPIAQKAVEWLVEAQNPGKGWRYTAKAGDNDTQMTGWCAMALHSAKVAGLEADFPAMWEGVNSWLDQASAEVQGVYRTGFTSPGGGSPRQRTTTDWVSHPEMDAVNVVLRMASGNKAWDVKKPSKQFRGQLDLFGKDLPVWEDKKVDYAYWHWATMALFNVGGADWDKWQSALLDVLLKNQRGWRSEDKDSFEAVLDEHGSWDSVDPWHPLGGRVWSTTINILTLQVVRRFMRLNSK